MTTEITHRCGHTIEHDQDFEDYFAARLQQRVCRDCYRAEYRASVERYAAQGAALPALTGSEKQIAWATALRGRLLEERPWYKRLIAPVTNARWWIDNRSQSLGLLLGRSACEREDVGALLAAFCGDARSCFWGPSAMSLQSSIHDAALGLVRERLDMARLFIELSAERALVIDEILTPPEGGDRARAGDASRAELEEILAELGKRGDRTLDARRREDDASKAAKLAAVAAAQAANEQLDRDRAAAELAARARAEDLARRAEPYRSVVRNAAPMPGDGDGYWTKRRASMLAGISLADLEVCPRGVEAIRVLASLSTRDHLKALERIHPTRLIAVALDPIALAEVVGAGSARAMYVAAGLPQPVIPRKRRSVAAPNSSEA